MPRISRAESRFAPIKENAITGQKSRKGVTKSKMKTEILGEHQKQALANFINLPERAQELYWAYRDIALSRKEDISYLDDALEELKYCESPIEKILYLELRIMTFFHPKVKDDKIYIELNPQTTIENYRVDIFIVACTLEYFDGEEHPTEFVKELIVECDGHDFHEKTKEQVAKNNNRDFELKNMGYDILHFSGSEVYNDPILCAKKVYDYISSCFDRMIEEKRESNERH